MSDQNMYSGSGVDYDSMDPFKRMAQEAARETVKNLSGQGFRELEWTRGESVYVIEHVGPSSEQFY